jgi:hypothetical protein
LPGAPCREELQALSTSPAEDEQLLADMQRLPGCQAQLEAAGQSLARAETAVQLAEARLAAATAAAAGGGDAGAGPGAAGAASASAGVEEAARQLQVLRQAVQQAATQQTSLAAEVGRLEGSTRGLVGMAVRFRLEKKRVLAASIASLEAAAPAVAAV